MEKTALFKFSPFSLKQKAVLTWWMDESSVKDKNGIICDGSIRSGKTTVMSLSFVIWAMERFSGENFALCGKTIASLERNVLGTLKRTVRSRGYRVQEKRSENKLIISKGNRSNDFYKFSGKDEASQDLIQGITLAGVLFDEAALMPESFINQATGRCSVDGSKFWFNCNPESPDHFIKKEWIDKLAEREMIRVHFTMHDNLSLSPDILHRYEMQYSGVFYDRFILGLWVMASGLVFPRYAEHEEDFLETEDDKWWDKDGKLQEHFSMVTIGVDFGGTGSKTTMVATGFREGYRRITPLLEEGLPLTDAIDAEAICRKFVNFYLRVMEEFGRVDWIFGDSASPTMINSIRSAMAAEGLQWRNVAAVKKNEVSERPKTVDLLLNTGRMRVRKNCTELRRAMRNLRWDEKKPNIPEDKNIENCNDWWDAFCYSWLEYVDYIDLNRKA